MTSLSPPAVALITLAAIAAPETPLDAIDREIRTLSPDRAILGLSAPPQIDERNALAHALGSLESDLRRRLIEIDADPDLLTDPSLRERRSDLAVRDLRLRIPIARARLAALDHDSSDADLRAALAALEPLEWAWGDAAAERRAALAALSFRAGDFQTALARAEQASPADPLVRDLRLAARAAVDRLESPPFAPDRVRIAIAGAARHSANRADALARRVLLEAPAAAIDAARRAALATLAEVAPPDAGPLAALAAASRASDARALARLADSPGALLAAEARLALAELQPPAIHLARALELHPNPAARRAAAGRITPHLSALADDRRLTTARRLLAEFADHPHAGRWRLDLAAVAPPAEALAALDRIKAADLAAAAAILAARRAHDAFVADPSERAAEALLRRIRAAETAGAPAAWRPWLLRAETEARLKRGELAVAAERVLSAPPGDAAPAAALLAPELLARARAAEAADDLAEQQNSAALAARLFAIADAPARRALALTLAREPEAALAELSGAVRTPAATLARAEALFALARDAEAFALYRDLADAAEASGEHADRFWRSWSRMLQIIQRQDPSRQEEIAREIRRLRIIDPALGGDPHRRRLESLLKAPGQAD
jgi:hypothetical protein